MYTLDKDYQEAYTDGSGRYKTIARAGQQVSWETAYAWGLVTTKHPPKEEKAEAPKLASRSAHSEETRG